MIAPLPPQPGLPQQSDSAGAKPDAKGEGDAFADILAAAAVTAQPPGPHLPGPAAMPDHGPVVVRAADLLPPEPAEPVTPVETAPQVGLTDPAIATKAARPDQPQPTARIFNQDGFFGSSVDAAASEAIGAAPVTRTLPGGITAPMPIDAETMVAATTGFEPAAGATAQPLAAAAGQAATQPVLVRAAVVPKGQLTAPAAPRPFSIEAESPDDPARPISRRLAFREAAARTVVQVAMRELEQGIHVAARADGLDPAERARLENDIAAMLSRHGLSARSIRISAPTRGRTSQERLK